MMREGQAQSFDAIERELAAYSDVAESQGTGKTIDKGMEDTFSPQVQVVRSSAKGQSAFWAQLEEEAAQSEREIIASYERRAAMASGEGSQTGAKAGDSGSTRPAGELVGETSSEACPSAEPLPAEPSIEERYARLMEVVDKKPGHREILIRTLRHCRQPREFSQVEAAIQAYPEYKLAGQNPFRLITFLIEGGGLEQLSIGFDGNELTSAQTAGLTEDEVDDLIDCFHLRTTEVGCMVADEMEPRRRIGNIFALFMDRQAYYTEIMQFCSQPRKFSEIEALFKGRDLSAVRTLNPEAGMAVKPTVFMKNLEQAGAIVWKDGWVVTREGEAFLKAIGS